MKRVLVACEFSGTVRDAFEKHGHDAWSCDLQETERGEKHYREDARHVARERGPWNLMIAHPPCTALAVSGARWWAGRKAEQAAAIEFVLELWSAPIEAIALENPIGALSTRWRKPDQIIQPWQFGEDASKATCLWLKSLPKLVQTDVLPGGRAARRANQTPSGQNRLGPSPNRAAERARTYKGIAEAMAEQWGTAISSRS